MNRLPLIIGVLISLYGAALSAQTGDVAPPMPGPAPTEAHAGQRQSTAITDLAKARGFRGEIAIDLGEVSPNAMTQIAWISPDMQREGYLPMPGKAALWPYASLTRQMLAARLLPELKNMGLTLDTPVSRVLPRWPKGPAAPTIRQLLQHRSGLRNPEDTPKGANGWPAFYNEPGRHGLAWCLAGRSAPPASGWRDNDCDYIVLGAVLEEVSLESIEYMLGAPRFHELGGDNAGASQLRMITAADAGQLYAMTSPEREVIPAHGASGALGGTLSEVLFFNWAQMRAYKDGAPALKPMWQGDPALGHMALGQWVFEVQPAGCSAPVKVAEHKGEIGRYRLGNIMLPDLQRSMAFATTDPGFAFGELAQGEGFIAEAVALLACDKDNQ